MRATAVWLFMILFALVPAAALAGIDEASEQAERLILRKLGEDRAYFLWRLGQHESGEAPDDLDAEAFTAEVRRARAMVPLIDYIVDTAREQPEGERIDLTRVRARVSPTYHQLALYLNLIGAVRAADYSRARILSDQIDLEVGFGPTQSIEGYRVQLTRHYYYLRAVALYHLHEDADAVQWFGQIHADSEVRAMNLNRRKEVDNVRLAGLSERPIAVTAFAPQDESTEHGWVGLAAADAVTDDLVNFTGLRVVERERVGELLEEMALGLMGVVNERHAVEVGQMVEAATLIYGSYRVEDGVLTLHGRLVHVESGAVLQSAIVRGSLDDLFGTIRELSTRLLGDAGLMSAMERQRIAGSRAPEPSAVRAVAQARLAAASQPDRARELFEEAMRADPAYANAHEELRLQFADVTATVAVMPLRNITARDEDAWLSDGLAELLGRDLPVLGFSTVERLELRRVMAYQLAMMGAADEAEAEAVLAGQAASLAAMGEQMAANFLVLGGFQRLGDDLKVNVRFVDVGSGQVLYTAGAEGPMAEYGRVVAEVVAALAEHVNRGLDADALASLVDGKPTLDEFERFMRAELARDALVSDEARSEAERDRLREEQEARARMQAELQARINQANARTNTRRYVAGGAAIGGLGLASAGLVAGAADRQTAGEYRALAQHALRQEDADANLALSQDHHQRANRWQVMGGVGVGVAVAATATMLLSGRVAPDLSGLDLQQAEGPHLSLSADLLPGGGAAGIEIRW